MSDKFKKMLTAAAPTAKKSVLETFFREEPQTDTSEKPTNQTVASNAYLADSIPLFNIRWYPNSKSCVKIFNHRSKPQQMPPLMVRKAEWRR